MNETLFKLHLFISKVPGLWRQVAWSSHGGFLCSVPGSLPVLIFAGQETGNEVQQAADVGIRTGEPGMRLLLTFT